MTEIDAGTPYNDDYNIKNQFDRILFHPERPLFQSELNELQSGQLTQQQFLADAKFHNGAILSGMALIYKGAHGRDENSSGANPNLFQFNDLKVLNGDLGNSNQVYADNGEIDYTSEATQDTDQVGLQVNYGVNNTDNITTLSFDITEVGSSSNAGLENIGFILSPGVKIQEAQVDGLPLQTDLTDDAGVNLTATDGSNVTLGDGNAHQVIITFDNTEALASHNSNLSFNLLFNNGFNSALEGCNVKLMNFKIEQGSQVTAWQLNGSDKDMAGNKNRTQDYSVSDGIVYLDGYVRNFNRSDIQLTNVGDEYIGLKLSHNTVTADQDQNLEDHTQGAQSDHAEGADRDKYTISLTYNDPSAVTIYHLHNGHVISTSNSGYNTDMNNTLARRTYDQSGSYRVRGLYMHTQPDTSNSDLIDINFDDGTAYVMGYEIESHNNYTTTSVSKTTGEINEEEHLFKNISTPIELINQPIDLDAGVSVYGVISDFSPDPDQDGTRGIPVVRHNDTATLDTIDIDYGSSQETGGNSSIQYVDYVTTDKYDNDPSKRIYANGNAFSLVNDDQIQWYNGNAIESDSTYYVHATVNKYFVGEQQYTRSGQAGASTNPDYVLITKGKGANAKTYIDFGGVDVQSNGKQPETNNAPGHQPSDGDFINVTYNAYKAREDLVTLDKNGIFHVVKGQPEFVGKVQPPYQQDPLTLNIGYIYVYPDSQKAYSTMASVTRTPFTGIQDMRNQLTSIKQNLAIVSERTAEMSSIDPITMQDTFSDNFDTLEKADSTDDTFDVAYSPLKFITPAFDAEGVMPLYVSHNNVDDTAYDSKDYDGVISNNYTKEVPLIQQDMATDAYTLNNGDMILEQGSMKLSPSEDTWTDSHSKTFDEYNPIAVSADYLYDQSHTDSSMLHNIGLSNTDINNFRDNYIHNGSIYHGFRPIYNGVIKNAECYIRPRTVKFHAANLNPNEDGFKITIGGFSVLKTNAEPKYQGSDNNSFRSDSKGEIFGSFQIPFGTVPTGTRTVRLANNFEWATASYFGYGVKALTLSTDVTTWLYVNNNSTIDKLTQAMNNEFAKVHNHLTNIDLHLSNVDHEISVINIMIATLLHMLNDDYKKLSDRITRFSKKTHEDLSGLQSEMDERFARVDAWAKDVEQHLSTLDSEANYAYSNISSLASQADSSINRMYADEQESSLDSESVQSQISSTVSSANDAISTLSYSADSDYNAAEGDIASESNNINLAFVAIGSNAAQIGANQATVAALSSSTTDAFTQAQANMATLSSNVNFNAMSASTGIQENAQQTSSATADANHAQNTANFATDDALGQSPDDRFQHIMKDILGESPSNQHPYPWAGYETWREHMRTGNTDGNGYQWPVDYANECQLSRENNRLFWPTENNDGSYTLQEITIHHFKYITMDDPNDTDWTTLSGGEDHAHS